MKNSSLIVNLSVLSKRPTGISVYAKNLISEMSSLEPKLFSAENIGFGLSSDAGWKGHARRLWWVQSYLRNYYHSTGASLIFSPLPEAPLFSKCRYIVTVHDIIPLRFPQYFSSHLLAYFRYYVRQVVTQAQHIVCDSVSTAQDLTDFYNVPASKITPILLAYNHLHFKPYSGDTKKYFLYLGRPDPHKNLSRLIQAFQRVSQKNPSLELWIVGPTDKRYTPSLAAQAESMGVSEKIRFLNYIDYDQLPQLIGCAIALVFPSLWEGFGLPPLEAMACGTPVITSNLASLPEVVGDAAILIDPYNSDDLANAMGMLANDSKLRNTLRIAGLERVQQFSWRKTGQQTVEVLKKFL